MESLEAYERTLVWTGQRVAGVRGDDFERPTPCTEWNVRAVVAHLVAGIWYYAALATGDAVERLTRGLSDLVGDDAFVSYDRAARVGLEAWRRPGAMDRICTLPFGEVAGRSALAVHQADVLVHGWDVAEATHQDATMDEPLAAFALDTARGFIKPEMRGRAYAAARPEPPGGDAAARLLAVVGRDPAWR